MCTFYVFQLLNLFLQDFSDLKDQGLALPTPTILGWERPELAALGIERPGFAFFNTKRSPPIGSSPEVFFCIFL